MKVFFYARDAVRGFDSHPADVIRVEIVQLFHPVLGKNIYQWCHYGQWVLENLNMVATKAEWKADGELAIENIQHAADVLAIQQGWTLLQEPEV